jgi:hypothetical protein
MSSIKTVLYDCGFIKAPALIVLLFDGKEKNGKMRRLSGYVG